MALDVDTLAVMTTAALIKLRGNYTGQRASFERQGRRHTPNLSTDLRSLDDAIRMINQIINLRKRKQRALDTFAS